MSRRIALTFACVAAFLGVGLAPAAALADDGFAFVGSTSVPFYGATATTLQSGKVLLAGGTGNTGYPISDAAVFDPQTNSFTATSAMTTTRYLNTATLLNTGKVLITGGYDDAFGVRDSAELFDPDTNSFAPVAQPMHLNRVGQTATLLPSGKVLIAGGGFTSDGLTTSAELFDPSDNSFTLLPNPMATARWQATATALPSGKVLIAGGLNASLVPMANAEIFDPATNTFTATAQPMHNSRAGDTATLLDTGKVLITGGYDENFNALSSADLYDPATDSFTSVGPMNSAREFHTATLLQSGKVLIAGGTDATNHAVASAEIFDPADNSFTPTADTMERTREEHAAALLPSGNVLLVGGADAAHTPLSNAEVYGPLGAPTAPGTPVADKPVNTGSFTISWNPASSGADSYTLLRRTAGSSDDWATVASGLTDNHYSFAPETEGRWEYAVETVLGDATSDRSATSDAVLVDNTPPEIDIEGCPLPARHGVGARITVTTFDPGASDDPATGSGIDTANTDVPSDPVDLDTSTLGPHSSPSYQATDLAGNSVTADCEYSVAPLLGVASKPVASRSINRGTFTLTWGAAKTEDVNQQVTYLISRRPASDPDAPWRSVLDDGTSDTHYAFTIDSPEDEGQWVYSVIPVDNYGFGRRSKVSATVTVDRTAPPAPTLSVADGQTSHTGNDGEAWYADSLLVDVTGNGDLPAGTASGLASFPSQFALTSNGVRTVKRTVKDRAGNKSDPGSLLVHIDARAPGLTLGCPANPVKLGKAASVKWSAYDGGSGVDGPASGTLSLDTGSSGMKSVQKTVTDNVGHQTTKTCNYQVS